MVRAPSPHLPDELSLLSDCLSGHPGAWDRFVERYSKLIYHSIIKTLEYHSYRLAPEDMEDIFNTIFLSFIEHDSKKLRQFEARRGCTLASWIRLISMRKTVDILRTRRQHVSLDGEDREGRSLKNILPDPNASTEEQIELAEQERLLSAAIEELSTSDKLFMKFYYEKSLPPLEISKIMNISVNTVYSRKNRIQDKIGKILKTKGFIARDSE